MIIKTNVTIRSLPSNPVHTLQQLQELDSRWEYRGVVDNFHYFKIVVNDDGVISLNEELRRRVNVVL